MKADNMFKRLGYTKEYENENIYYYKDIEVKDEYICFILGHKCVTKHACYSSPGWITKDEMKAIEKKCKELEWYR